VCKLCDAFALHEGEPVSKTGGYVKCRLCLTMRPPPALDAGPACLDTVWCSAQQARRGTNGAATGAVP